MFTFNVSIVSSLQPQVNLLLLINTLLKNIYLYFSNIIIINYNYSDTCLALSMLYYIKVMGRDEDFKECVHIFKNYNFYVFKL